MFNIEIVKFSGVILSHVFSQRHALQVSVMGISGLQEGTDVAFLWLPFFGELLKNLWPPGNKMHLYSPKEVLKWHDPGRRKDSIGQILISNLIWKTSVTKTPERWASSNVDYGQKILYHFIPLWGHKHYQKRWNTSLCLSFLPWVFHLPNSVGDTLRSTALHSWGSWPIGISRTAITGIFNVHSCTALKAHSSLPNAAMAAPYQ